MKKSLSIFMFLGLFTISMSFESTMGLKINNKNGKLNDIFNVKLQHFSSNFEFNADLEINNDGKYNFLEKDYLAEHYFYIREGNLTINNEKNIELKAGRMELRDEVETPYSLFFSSNKNSGTGIEIKYEDEIFFFKTRWIELSNKLSKPEFGERATNYKVYGIKNGNIRLGFQDVVVYTQRNFDVEYFVNPVPVMIIQEMMSGTESPWQTNTNENTIMGFFADYKEKNNFIFGQILVDDINMNRILHPDRQSNPDKIAWSTGIKFDFMGGRMGFYHAGATKYTFEPMGSENGNTKYGYTFYPNCQYWTGADKVMELNDLYIGYVNGENNIAFKTEFEKNMNDINMYFSAETIISGAKSPVNPWHDYMYYTEGGYGTKFLDGETEKRYIFTLNGEKKINKMITANIGISAGIIANELKPENPKLNKSNEYNSYKIWYPSGQDKKYFNLGAGIEVKF